ncbi:unnamed protein product [Candidula unifasciata]|uniref:Cytochrome P450 n=1 Tax=Candidula unifasciata TaxID=100452 RepID=A0A8S3Z3G2_9EUPU|nr:unnamed protein product [Candidula unifasciata]
MELALITAAIVLLAIFFWFQRQGSNLPPFPKRPLPIFGNLFHMEDNPRPQFQKWREQFGDVFSLNMAGKLVVVLNGFDVLKEAFVKKADVFSDRSPVFFDQVSGFAGKGIVFSSGDVWKEQRTVAISILKKFGMGKNFLAEKIQEEVDAYLKCLAQIKGRPINIRAITNVSVSNIISAIILGRRFEHDDKAFVSLMDHLNNIVLYQQNVGVLNFIPWLMYLPGDLFKAKAVIRSINCIISLLTEFINSKKHDDSDYENTDNFIEAYLAERNKKVKAGLSTCMDDTNLNMSVSDLFCTGTETVSTTICWFVLYMLNFPDIQEKLYQEIKEQIGLNRQPNIQDRNKLPFLNAAIMETSRLASLVPLAGMYSCSEEVTLRGYTIPKGTFIVPNLDSVLLDKTIWGEDVLTFRPERFLDANGKVKDREELIPFGIGRRACLGEALAQMELFLFLSNMCQRFQFLPKDKVPPKHTDYVFGFTCTPCPYKVRIVERNDVV